MIEIWDALQFLVSLYNIKNAKNTYRGVLILTKSNTPPWLFFTFFNLQMVPNCAKHRILSLLECFKPFWNYFFLAAKIMELLETLLLGPTPRFCLGPSRGVITPFIVSGVLIYLTEFSFRWKHFFIKRYLFGFHIILLLFCHWWNATQSHKYSILKRCLKRKSFCFVLIFPSKKPEKVKIFMDVWSLP